MTYRVLGINLRSHTSSEIYYPDGSKTTSSTAGNNRKNHVKNITKLSMGIPHDFWDILGPICLRKIKMFFKKKLFLECSQLQFNPIPLFGQIGHLMVICTRYGNSRTTDESFGRNVFDSRTLCSLETSLATKCSPSAHKSVTSKWWTLTVRLYSVVNSMSFQIAIE